MLSEEDFRSLYDVHYTAVLNFVRGAVSNEADVEELVQDVFVRVARNYQHFRGQSRLRTWILSIARNAVVDFWRKQKKHLNSETNADDKLEHLVSNEADPLQHTVKRSEADAVRACIERLPESMRLVLLCRVYQGLNTVETAHILGWTQPRVRVTQSRAMRKFSTLWQQQEGDAVGLAEPTVD